MDVRRFFLDAHAVTHGQAVAKAEGWNLEDIVLRDITAADLRRREPSHTSIAWLLWHMTRTEDVVVNAMLQGAPPLSPVAALPPSGPAVYAAPPARTPATAPSTTTWRLVVLQGYASVPVLDLDRPLITIGRDPANLLHVTDPRVSARHARVLWVEGRWLLVDVGSRMGTYVNDQRITRHTLAPGDHIRLGDAVLMVQGPGP